MYTNFENDPYMFTLEIRVAFIIVRKKRSSISARRTEKKKYDEIYS